MAHSNANGILRAMIDARDAAIDLDDAALLRAFAERREQPAFAELVRRHGPMVLGVCRRVAGPSADDAFQAAFLVLARKAAGIREPKLLAHWLHGVAVRVARRAKRTADRRRRREVPMANLPDRGAPTREIESDLLSAIDAELLALPEWYRLPIVLCDLQGLSRSEAAARLGIPEGTLSSRLANGRQKLADRLSKRGIAPALVIAFFADAARAAVPYELFETTVQTAMAELFGGAAPSAVAQLASEGISTMGKFALAGLLVSLSALGVLMGTAPAEEKKVPPATPAVAEKRGEEKAEGKSFGKPRMAVTREVYGSPRGLFWCTENESSLLIVDGVVSKSELIVPANPAIGTNVTRRSTLGSYNPKLETFTNIDFNLPDSRLIAISPRSMTVVMYREDRRGINRVHQLRFVKYDFRAHRSSDSRSFNLDTDSGSHFQLTPDEKGIWSSFEVADDQGKPVQTGLRLVDIATGDVLKTIDAIDGAPQSVHFDDQCRFAVARTIKDGKYGVVCWNLETGKVAWSSNPPKMYGPSASTISRDGKIATVAYRMDAMRQLISGADREQPFRAGEVADWAETMKQLDANPTTIIHVIETATGRTLKEILLKKMETVDELVLSPDGRLLVSSGLNYSTLPSKQPFLPGGFGGPRVRGEQQSITQNPFAQVWDTESGKTIYRWNGSAIFSFDPNAKNGAILAIAESLPQSRYPRESDWQGRIGIWKFVPESLPKK